MVRQLNHPSKMSWEKKVRVRVLKVHKVFGLKVYESVYYKKGERKKDWTQRAHYFYDAESGFLLCHPWGMWCEAKSTRQLKKHLREYVEDSKIFFKDMCPEVSGMTEEDFLKWKIKREKRMFETGERRF